MKDLKEEGEDSEEKNPPLSREGWIMLLSGEIHHEEIKLFMFGTAFIVIPLTFVSVVVVLNIDNILPLIIVVSLIFTAMVCFLIYWRYYFRTLTILELLKGLREDILSGKLDNPNKEDFEKPQKTSENTTKGYRGETITRGKSKSSKIYERWREINSLSGAGFNARIS